MLLVVGLAVVLAFAWGVGSAQDAPKPAPASAPAGTVLKWGFEKENSNITPNHDAPIALVKDKAAVTEGGSALKITLKKGTTFQGIIITDPAILSGWDKAKSMALDVRNGSEDRLWLTVRIEDVNSTEEANRYEKGQGVVSGSGTVRVQIKDLVCPNGNKLDTSKLQKMILYVEPKGDADFFMDNLRLEGVN